MNAVETHVEKLKADLGEIELKVTTGFTLADAIRMGAQSTEQAHGTFVNNTSSCALGAAYIAAQAAGYIVK